MKTVNTLNSELSSAEICRRNDWIVGTVLCGTGTEPRGDIVDVCIIITAIGTSLVIGRWACLIDLTSHEWNEAAQ